jgi:hypothetical protein
MAKKLIKNYFFTPGVGLDDNAYPDAWSLLSRNKTFIQKEIVAFINKEVEDAVKCERDLGYFIDGVSFDTALGTNYNAIFLGIAQSNSYGGEVNKTVQRFIQRAGNRVKALSAVTADATALTRVNEFFDEAQNIFVNGRASYSTHVFSDPTTATVSQLAVKNRLTNNIGFITAEINSWVNTNYPAHDHDVSKCTRDVQYALYSVIYDILYGGNSATYDNAKFFFYFDPDLNPGIDPDHKAQTVAAYDRLASICNQIVQGVSVTKTGTYAESQDLSGDNASGSDATAIENLLQIIESLSNLTRVATPSLRTAVLPNAWPLSLNLVEHTVLQNSRPFATKKLHFYEFDPNLKMYKPTLLAT